MSNRNRIAQPLNDRVRTIGRREYSDFGLTHGVYHFPIDEIEEERQEELNSIINTVVKDEKERRRAANLDDFEEDDEDDEEERSSLLVPFAVSSDEVRNVLDLGHGKGVWIDQFLKEYEDCIVTGVDIFLGEDSGEDEPEDDPDADDEVQEYVKKRWNLNAPFAQDRSSTALLPETFDLINCRCLAEGINRDRWPSLVSELKALLKPGGRLQMFEIYLLFQSDNGRLPDTSASNAWWAWYTRFMDISGRDARIGRHLERYCRAAGFEKVIASQHRLPIGRWDASQQGLGVDVRSVVDQILSMFGIPFVQVAGMSIELCRMLISTATEELHQDNLKPYIQLFSVTARRPQGRQH